MIELIRRYPARAALLCTIAIAALILIMMEAPDKIVKLTIIGLCFLLLWAWLCWIFHMVRDFYSE